MSIENLIKSRNIKQEQIASTIRLPDDLHTKVDELAEYLGLSRQAMMLELISESTEEAWKMIRDRLKDNQDDEEIVFDFHMLNTNKGSNLADHKNMLNEGIASAFYDPWKLNIKRIKENDIVFLYENGVGIIAYGKGTGRTLIKDHYGNKDEWYYQELEGFKILDKPISAKEIKKILDRNVVFLRTMSSMHDGKKVLDFIKKL